MEPIRQLCMGAFTAPCQPRCLLAADAGVPFLNSDSRPTLQGITRSGKDVTAKKMSTLRKNERDTRDTVTVTNISVCWRRIFLSRYNFSHGTSGHFWMSASPKKCHVMNQNGTPGQERDRKIKDNYLKYKRVSRCPVCPVQKHTGRSCVCFCRYALAV